MCSLTFRQNIVFELESLTEYVVFPPYMILDFMYHFHVSYITLSYVCVLIDN